MRGRTRMWLQGLAILGLLLCSLASEANAQAPTRQDINRYNYYPYYYFPHNYWPNQVRWPNPNQPFQRPPNYMAYPPYLDPDFRYDLFEWKRYYKGHHFFLDQF